MSGVLLDTCAAIWLGEGARMSAEALEAIEAAAAGKAVAAGPIRRTRIKKCRRQRLQVSATAQRVLLVRRLRPVGARNALPASALPRRPGDIAIISNARHRLQPQCYCRQHDT
jgi:hypothetical protein